MSFSVSVHDQANPSQFATANYTILFVPPAGGNITFTQQPPNYVGGIPSPNSPVIVHVADNTNAPIPGANVTVSLNGTPPCSTAVLSGTLTQQTNATGDAFFGDLSVDRGQIGYALKGAVSSAFGISNPFTVNGFCGSGDLGYATESPTLTLLTNGQVLITGGQVDQGPAASNQANIYDPATKTFTPTSSSMNSARLGHTATLLNDGTVLIVGGQSDSTTYLASAEIFNPTDGGFTLTSGHLTTPRAGHTATLLADGTVLIAGGFNGSVLSSAELYNPQTQTFTVVGPLTTARYTHTATLLPNGKSADCVGARRNSRTL